MVRPPSDVEPGTVLSGRYRLEAPVGRGATSTVWRARDVELGRLVAVKVLDGHELSDRFAREGAILGRLSHPNLVAVHGAGHDADRRYLVTDLVDGVPLDEVLRDGPVPVDEALHLVAAVADGLATAHAAGVVHRDVKPANIVCGRDGSPRLVDFGIARADGATALTAADTMLGTAAYLSPEQARGEAPGPAGDVYALGCVLHELLTGVPPFDGEQAVVVAYRHVHEDAAPPSTRASGIPPAVDAVVLRCLGKDPATRYADAGALAAELRAVAAGAAPEPAPAPTPAASQEEVADADATVAVPAIAATPPPDGTLVLPVVADAGERIDRSPLAPPAPGRARRWGLVAAASAGVLLVALLLGALGGDGTTAPVDAGEEPAATTTVVTAAVVEEEPPAERGPREPKEPKESKDGPGEGRGRGR